MTRDHRAFYFQEAAARNTWDEFTDPMETRRRLKKVFDVILSGVNLEGARLLDAGSGGGHFSEEAHKRGAVVTSLDLGRVTLKQVVRRCRVKAVAGDLLAPPFAPNTFDIVICTEVIEHTPDPEAAAAWAAGLVAPGGVLALTSPSRPWQPIVRLATMFGFRKHKGIENFLWPGQCVQAIQSQGMKIEQLFGFNVIPVFKPWFEPVQAAAEAALSERAPWLFVNYGIKAFKPENSWSRCD